MNSIARGLLFVWISLNFIVLNYTIIGGRKVDAKIGFLDYIDNHYIPTLLKSWDYYNVNDSSSYTELYAWITDQSTVFKEEIGEVEKITPRNPI